MRGVKTLTESARMVRSRFVDGSIVLLYHRIVDAADDPFSMNVSPGRFAEHLQAIRRIGDPMSLNSLVDAIERHQVRHRCIVVTFDDGYADNLREALPLLEQYQVPATVFVTSDLLGREGECWWDALARMMLAAARPSGPLRLDIAGKPHVLRPDAPRRLLRRVHRLLRVLDDEGRREALSQVSDWTRVEVAAAVPAHPTLSSVGLKQLAASPLIEIGAHTATHPVLSDLPPVRARHELQTSKAVLERILERPVTSLAYPYGQALDYSKETLSLARSSGYRCGCTAIPDIVWRRTDPFQLPRLWVNNWSSETLTRALSNWLHR